MVTSTLQIATVLALLGLAAAGIRVQRVALNRATPIFSAYLIFELVRSTTLFSFSLSSPVYFWTYVGSALPLWTFYVLMVREIFGLFFAGYPGIRTASQYLLYVGMAIAVLVSAVTLMASWRSPMLGRGTTLYYVWFIERGIVFALAVFLMIMLAYLPQYRVLLKRNVVVHAAVFGALFLGDALVLLMQSLSPQRYMNQLNVALEMVSVCCYWAWAVLLKREEAVRAPSGLPDATVETPLVRQLAALNTALIRSSGGRSKRRPIEPVEFSSENSAPGSAPLEYEAAEPDVRSKPGPIR